MAKAAKRIIEGIEAAVEESVESIANDAVDNAPDDETTTGALKESIEGRSSGTRGTVAVYGPAAEYAIYPEEGTSEQEAQHYMLSAAEAERPKLERRVAGHVQARLPRRFR
jgi:HK97 gp10 family phage protein